MTSASGPVPVGRGDLESRDATEVRELISRRYVDHEPRILGDPRRFTFRSRSASAGGLTVDHIEWDATMAITTEPFRTILIVGVLDGLFDVAAGRERSRVRRGGTILYLPHVPLDVIMDRMAYQVVQFPAAWPARIAGRLGIDPADFRFERMTPVSATANRRLLATTAYLTRLFAGAEPAGLPPLVLAAAAEMAASTVLTVFPNTTMTVDYVAGSGRTAPVTVRRAVAYIDAHAGEPITVDQIAAAAGVSVRGLQAAFERHRHTSPTAYLRRVRLEHAHRELQAADQTGGDTVAGIARRWGFTAPGRFAVEYRKTFGRLPSHTLRT